MLSQNYVRMVRNELWSDDPSSMDRRLAIYAMIAFALQTIDMLLHPVSPFATEYLYQEVFAGGEWKRPLLVADYPQVDLPASAGHDRQIVDLALEVESACNAARMKAKLKRRWPLKSLLLRVSPDSFSLAEEARELIALLCNVKEVSVVKSVADLPVTFELAPNRSRVGAMFKEKSNSVSRLLKPIQGDEAWDVHQGGKPPNVTIDQQELEVPASIYDLNIKGTETWEAVAKGPVLVAVEKVRDDKLIAEGLMRDVARRLQALRKARGYSPTAILERASVAGLDEEMTSLLKPLEKELAYLVRVKEVRVMAEKSGDAEWEEDELDGRPIYIDVS